MRNLNCSSNTAAKCAAKQVAPLLRQTADKASRSIVGEVGAEHERVTICDGIKHRQLNARCFRLLRCCISVRWLAANLHGKKKNYRLDCSIAQQRVTQRPLPELRPVSAPALEPVRRLLSQIFRSSVGISTGTSDSSSSALKCSHRKTRKFSYIAGRFIRPAYGIVNAFKLSRPGSDVRFHIAAA
jgi:hypothetical protein